MIRSGIVKLAPFYIVSGDFGCHKPCKEVFIESAKKIELPCEEILFVGDTAETDIIGAKSVGMKTAWIKMVEIILYQISQILKLTMSKNLDQF